MRPDVSYAQMCELIARLALSSVNVIETNSYYSTTPSEQLQHISKRVARLEDLVKDFAQLSFDARQMITHRGITHGSIKRNTTKTNTVTGE